MYNPCWLVKHAVNIKRRFRRNVNLKVLVGWIWGPCGWRLCGIVILQWRVSWRTYTFDKYSPCKHTACHSNPVNYLTFFISILGLVLIRWSGKHKRECFPDHLIFMQFGLPFPSVVPVLILWCGHLMPFVTESQSLFWAFSFVFRDDPLHNIWQQF